MFNFFIFYFYGTRNLSIILFLSVHDLLVILFSRGMQIFSLFILQGTQSSHDYIFTEHTTFSLSYFHGAYTLSILFPHLLPLLLLTLLPHFLLVSSPLLCLVVVAVVILLPLPPSNLF